MDMKQMLNMVIIAQEGGISKAAAKLFITQSALDQQLLKLEHELGTPLFDRSRNTVSLTEAGRIYVDYAQRILELKHEAYSIIRDLTDQQRGTINLAFAPEWGIEMFTNVYPRFHQIYPQVEIVPREAGTRRQLELLNENGTVDLGFISRKAGALPGIDQVTLCQEEFLLITPQNHPLAARAAPPGEPLAVLDVSHLRELTFCLIHRRSTQREIIDTVLATAGGRTILFLETDSNWDSIAMVHRGLSCSILPACYARAAKDVARFRLSTHPTWIISACYRRGHYLSQAARHFIQLTEEYFHSIGSAPAETG